jgi:RNA polymerase sigma factor (sigma-70 family)
MEPATPISGCLHQLASRIHNGDGGAEGELVATFGERIMAMVLARGKDPDAALDITQNVLIAVICAARQGRIRDGDSLPGFVYGTARNLTANHFRVVTRQREDPLDIDVPVPSLEDQIIQAERVRLTREALANLSVKDCRILTLTLVDGLKPSEIAEQMGLNPEVVRMRKSRALRKVVDRVKGMLRKPSLRPLPGEAR